MIVRGQFGGHPILLRTVARPEGVFPWRADEVTSSSAEEEALRSSGRKPAANARLRAAHFAARPVIQLGSAPVLRGLQPVITSFRKVSKKYLGA